MRIFRRQNLIQFLAVIIVLVLNLVTSSPLLTLNDLDSTPVNYTMAAESRKAYLGGFPIGLSIKTDGVLVVAVVPINTEAGEVMPSTSARAGDIIKKINGNNTVYTNDILEILKNTEPTDGKVRLEIVRGEQYLTFESTLLKEDLSGNYKLGLAVRDSVSGVGTVTFIKPEGTFGCLGHAICDSESGMIIPCSYGNVFDCKIIGYNKGVRGKAGELKGVFTSGTPSGNIYTNTKFGVFGRFSEKDELGKIMEVADRFSVNVGKAQIYCTIQNSAEFYDIEIVKAVNQSLPSDRSMILRVTDKRLLNSTGGIVQGMSGSPIVQNNKIVGAVTHVFVNDPTKGYGLYADWMYGNI